MLTAPSPPATWSVRMIVLSEDESVQYSHRKNGHLPVPRLAVGPVGCKPSGDRRRRSGELTPDPSGRPKAVAFDQPLLVVPPPELPQGLEQLRDGGERPDPEQVLL